MFVLMRQANVNRLDQRALSVPWHYITYAMPVVAMIMMQAPLVIVQGVYAKYYGLPLTTIAWVVLLGRLFDAITDPLIGYFSDRYRLRHGTRKPLIIAGSLCMVLSAYFLYAPLYVSGVYLGFWLFIFYLSYTLFDIPHNAWASELATQFNEKSAIFSYRSAAVFLGLILFYLTPMLPFFETQDITPEVLQVSISISGVVMLVSIIVCSKYTPNSADKTPHKSHLKTAETASAELARHKIPSIDIVRKNIPFCLFFSSQTFYGLGNGMWLGLVFIYVDSFLGLGGVFAQVFLLSYLFGMLMTPIWCKVANSVGKKAAMIFAFSALITSYLYTGYLAPDTATFRHLLVLNVLNTLGTSCLLAIAPAMLSKIADYGDWRLKAKNTAFYFSLYAFLGKAGIALGAALGLALAGVYGFDASAETHASDTVFGLKLSMTLIPIVFVLLAIGLAAVNPINARYHSIVRRRMDAKKDRGSAMAKRTSERNASATDRK